MTLNAMAVSETGNKTGAGDQPGTGSDFRQSRTQRAHGSLRRLILDNELRPGKRMFEQEVADYLKMSRTPVREALIRLAEEGLVEVRPRHGMTVLPISPGDMRDVYDVVASLEATAAELAIEKGVDPDQIRRLNESLDQMERALRDEDRVAWAHGDEEFHRLLVQYSGNERLISIVSGLWDQTHRARWATLSARPLPVASNVDHRELVKAIESGNAKRAKKLHISHRRRSRELLVKLLIELDLHEV